MVPENKQNKRYKQKEVHPPYSPDLAPAGARSREYGGLLFRHTTYIAKD
jgi:hypothetical protein